MREIVINLTLKFTVPENLSNINGLLMGLREAIPQIFIALVTAIVAAIEEQLIEILLKHEPQRYVKNGRQSTRRTFNTSYGVFKYRPAQIYDKIKKKSLVPLRESGFFPPYRRYTDEAMEAGVGLAIQLSYRKSVKEINRLKAPSTFASHTTLHRYVQRFAKENCNFPCMKNIPYRFLMVDGTKVRLQGAGAEKLGNAEMRLALASVGENEPFDVVGFWVGKSWKEIRRDLEKRLDYKRLEVLFSDGEPGIGEALLDEGMRYQRCVLHGKRDFSYVLYMEGLKKAEQSWLVEKMKDIPVFKLSKPYLEELCPDDWPRVKELADRTWDGFQGMLEILTEEKYPMARAYVKNLACNILTFFDWWIEKRDWIPLNTNEIESEFSRINNRIKRIGRRWGESGLLNWLMIAVKKIFSPETWGELWSQYLAINPEFKLKSMKVFWRWI